MEDIFNKYLKKIQDTYFESSKTELTYYPHLKDLIESLSNKIGKKVIVVSNPSKQKLGMPDFLIKTKDGKIIGYIEAKEVDETNLDKISNTEQLTRYRKLPNLILTNFNEFILFKEGRIIDRTALTEHSLIVNKKKTILKHEKDFLYLFKKFLSFSILKVFDSKSLAIELAKRTKFLSDGILDELKKGEDEKLLSDYEAFKEGLIRSLRFEDFADYYAQTLTYGLFFAKIEAKDNHFSRESASFYIPKSIPLLQRLFHIMNRPDLPKSLEWSLNEIVSILSNTNLAPILEEFHTKIWTKDPVIHFYETFLAEYNPKERKLRGVYYTPDPVVFYIVRSIHEILKMDFKRFDGLADKGITLLDPAAGTLTFPKNAINVAINEYKRKGKSGFINNLISNHILKNFYAFELLVAPYSIGHFRIHVILQDIDYKFNQKDRFQFYLTNTLEFKGHREKPLFPDLAKEGEKAREIKQKIPILVIFGNPPYSMSSINKSEWILDKTKDYKKGLKERRLGNLDDDYVKFIRFSQWKIEQNGKGIIGFITNNSFIWGVTFRRMRESLLKTFDRLYILNLHGDSKRNEICQDGNKDENVFDIQQGVCISIFIKNNKYKGKKVYYSDLYGLRNKKYAYLIKGSIKKTKWIELEPKEPYYFFVPKDFSSEGKYKKLLSITNIFAVYGSGIKTHKDYFVVKYSKERLKDIFKNFLNKNNTDKLLKKKYKLEDTSNWNIKDARKNAFNEKNILRYNYRPFDKRWIYYEDRIITRPLKYVMKNFIKENIALVTNRLAKNKFSDVFITDCITDIHFFGGQSYIFPLFLYENNGLNKKSNIKKEVITLLKNKYNKNILIEEIFNYIYGVLHSDIYHQKYLEFLQIDFPRIPFPDNFKLFKEISRLGKQLIDIHLIRSPLLNKYQGKFPIRGSNKIEFIKYEKNSRVRINKTQYFSKIPPEVWDYHIGEYQILEKWLKDRKETKLSKGIDFYLKIISLIKNTLKIKNKIDKLYSKVERKVISLDEFNILNNEMNKRNDLNHYFNSQEESI